MGKGQSWDYWDQILEGALESWNPDLEENMMLTYTGASVAQRRALQC